MTVLDVPSAQLSSGIDFDRYEIHVGVSKEDLDVSSAKTFDECGLPEALLRNIRRVGFVKPTPVQRGGIPLILNEVNLLASSQPGSGKTAAYLLPIIAKLLEGGARPDDDPRALILVPTRELAIQVERMTVEFTRGTSLHVCALFGGRKLNAQLADLQGGCDILIATPGRLCHLLNSPKEEIDLSDVRFFVLDEADKLLGKQFKDEMATITEDLSPEEGRQTILTTHSRYEKLGSFILLSDYVVLDVGSADGAILEIDVERRVIEEKPLDALVEVLKKETGKQTLIVANSRPVVAQISEHLELANINSAFIHGLLDQNLREEAVDDFRMGRVEILVASGIMGMGLDVKRLGHVVDFNRRAHENDYVFKLDHTNESVRSKITYFTFPKRFENCLPRAKKPLNVAESEFPRVIQTFLKPPQKKYDHALSLISANENTLTLIFAQPSAAKVLLTKLKGKGTRATSYLTALDSKNLENVKTRANTTLVTTDPDVVEKLGGTKIDRVINFVLPPFDQYVKMAKAVTPHGRVYSYYHSNRDSKMAGLLRRLILVTNQELPTFLGGT